MQALSAIAVQSPRIYVDSYGRCNFQEPASGDHAKHGYCASIAPSAQVLHVMLGFWRRKFSLNGLMEKKIFIKGAYGAFQQCDLVILIHRSHLKHLVQMCRAGWVLLTEKRIDLKARERQ